MDLALIKYAAALRLLLQGNTADTKAILRAHRDVFRQRAYWQQKRRQYPEKLLTTQRPGVYRGSLVWAYFARQIRAFSQLPAQDFRTFPGTKKPGSSESHPVENSLIH